MAKIDSSIAGIEQKTLIPKSAKEERVAKNQTPAESVITKTKPDISSIQKAENLLGSLTGSLGEKALAAQTENLNEERIRALLSDD